METAKKTGNVILQEQGLKEVPKAVLQITNMRMLNMEGNKLAQIPPALAVCVKGLKTLNLSHNSLTVISNNVMAAMAGAIETIDISFNSISHLPAGLSGCGKLKTLIAHHNGLTSDEGGQDALASLSSLSKLRVINLSHNRLTAFPAGFCQLPRLEEANLAANGITAIPVEVKGMKQLRTLDVGHNRIQSIPPDVLRFSSISRLTVEGNALNGPIEDMDGYKEYMARRKERIDKQIHGGISPDLAQQ